MLIIGPDGTILTDRRPAAWVDTNVMLEVYSFLDLHRAMRSETASEVEQRRVQLQTTLWMAMTLCHQKAVTVSYLHEARRVFEEKCASDPVLLEWSRVILFVLGDGGVFDGWTAGTTNAGENAENWDTFMAEECARWGIPLVSRDGNALKKAKARSVKPMTPEEYAIAADAFPCSLAARLFMDRLDKALARFVAKGPREQAEQRECVTQQVRERYVFIWRPSGPAEPFSAEAMFR